MNENRTYAILGVAAIMVALFTTGFKVKSIFMPGPTPTPMAPIASPEPPQDRNTMEAEIKMAIEQGDQATIEAMSSGDASGLSRYFTGAALKRERKVVADLISARQRQDATLHKLTFDDIVIDAEGKTATATLTERWSHKIRSAETNEILSESEATDQPQTISLVHTPQEGWLITAISWKRNEPDPVPTPEPTPLQVERNEPEEHSDDEEDYAPAPSYITAQIQARYSERAAAFERRDLEGYFAYALPEWTWRSEEGDRSELSESKEYYRNVFRSGVSRSLETRILKTYQVSQNIVAAEVLIGTLRAGDEARLIRQLDIWVRRGGGWYCLAEKRLARTGAFPLSELASLVDED